MPKESLQSIGKKLLKKRSSRGIREVAKEIGISPATLSRVERGHLPDIGTFTKICKWLNIDPGEILGFTSKTTTSPQFAIHFRKNRELAPETAQSLAKLILAAQRALNIDNEGEESE